MIEVNYLDHMGSDLTVVNAARVSFKKRHNEFDTEKDAGLINYLARHKHWTPFAHPQISLHIKAPIFVARQLAKHQIGMVWNEVSRRYVDDTPELYWPDEWRGKASDKKQGSSDVVMPYLPISNAEIMVNQYMDAIEDGYAPEQARMLLPQNAMTEWHWTGSLSAWARVYGLRAAPDSQKESQIVAGKIKEIIEPLYPFSWGAMCQD